VKKEVRVDTMRAEEALEKMTSLWKGAPWELLRKERRPW